MPGFSKRCEIIMTQLIFDKKPDDDQDQWTTARLAEESFLDLVRVTCEIKKTDENGVQHILHYKKYYNQARDLMFRIPITEQYPKTEEEVVPFVIDWSDLSPRVQAEFSEYSKVYSKQQIRLFLKQVVIRLFENLDYSYAHMSVMKKLRVRLSC
jgi:hypothetical protein